MDEPVIRLTGLTKLDKAELGQKDGIRYEAAELEEGQHGVVDLFTAMIAISMVSAVAAYLLKKHNNQSFEEDVEIVHSDGRVERRRVRWNAQSSEAPDAAIIGQIRGPSLKP